MKKYTLEQLKDILERHAKWLRDEDGGKRANLSGADLSGAYLSSANLSSANLSAIKEDMMDRMAGLSTEVIYLYKSLIDGKVDGSSYTGQCACFVGTLANATGVGYETFQCNADSPTEKFFLAIRKGDTPVNNQVSAIVVEWVEEFMTAKNIAIPQRTISWGS